MNTQPIFPASAAWRSLATADHRLDGCSSLERDRPIALRRGQVWLSAVEWLPVPAFVAAWGLAGFDGSVGRALIGHLIGSDSPALAGLALFIVSASAALAAPLLRSTPPRTVMLIGTIALLTGVATALCS
jgi:hypothetical protein